MLTQKINLSSVLVELDRTYNLMRGTTNNWDTVLKLTLGMAET